MAFGETPKQLMVKHIGKMDDLNDILEINRLDLLKAYRSLGWDMGNLAVDDTNTIMRVLSGEQSLIPGQNAPELEQIIGKPGGVPGRHGSRHALILQVGY